MKQCSFKKSIIKTLSNPLYIGAFLGGILTSIFQLKWYYILIMWFPLWVIFDYFFDNKSEVLE